MFVSLKSDLSIESAIASTAAGCILSRCESSEETASPTPVKAEKTFENLLAQTAEGMDLHLGVS